MNTIKIGTRVKGKDINCRLSGTVVRINTDPAKKPLAILDDNGGEWYSHYEYVQVAS